MSRATAIHTSLAVLLLVLAGCGGPEKVERPELPEELKDDPRPGDEPLSLQDDYWTSGLGTYLSPEELHQYWIEPHDKRFVSYGERWLEFTLREDLLREKRVDLTPGQLAEFRDDPDFDTAKRTLEAFGRKKSE